MVWLIPCLLAFAGNLSKQVEYVHQWTDSIQHARLTKQPHAISRNLSASIQDLFETPADMRAPRHGQRHELNMFDTVG
ncbi:hypothetical protein F4775DRAFT_559643 [Biscogniauxia sp. FL1348]|nr:hypothetical protein F4775DRAFT_559643 [Biscogniauxia sp. FL1348]